VAFFERASKLKLKHSRLSAFGSTRRHARTCDDDPSIQSLLRAETPVVTIFGKSWLLHVTDALRLTPEENLEIIEDSVRYLAARVPHLIYEPSTSLMVTELTLSMPFQPYEQPPQATRNASCCATLMAGACLRQLHELRAK